MKILSLFDGMACGMLALLKTGIEVEKYIAYEIDKYCIQTTKHNFPEIEHRGDVFNADFTEYKGYDMLIGGSPCTYWSIAQKNNRETEASGLGWELFSQYLRAIKEAKPKYFVYENNKSMSKAIRESIDKAFGFEAVLINSALLSAQNRQRLYWVGKRNEDGTYSKVDVVQPEDRGILLKDILETGMDLTSNNKSWALTASYDGAVAWNTIERSQRNMVAEPIKIDCYELDESSIEKYNNSSGNRIGRIVSGDKNKEHDSQQYRVYNTEGKSVTLCASSGGLGKMTGLYAIPHDCPAMRVREATKQGYADIEAGDCVDLTHPNSKTRRGRSMKDKSNCLMTSCQYYQYCGTVNQPIYEVKDGMITIKGKQYPIKLVDGYYIIRKLTVRECMRLQTVPEWYEFPVSNAQAYKMLGNGWTVDVIAHIFAHIREDFRKE